MIKNWLLASLICPLSLLAQEKGVAFEHNLTWNEILQKAKEERKYVFVDLYSTWCGPCKYMDQNVYTDDDIGQFMNSHFVSVKIQMDSTSHDNSDVQRWYSVANQLGRDYRIMGYPSFLFFSPDGQAVDKKVGGREIKAFMEMSREAMNPTRQFYALLSRYQSGNKIYDELPRLAGMAKDIGEDSLANALAADYMQNYLVKLPKHKRWTKENISFVNDYENIITPEERLFKLYFKDRKAINFVMKDTGFASGLINRLIYRYDIDPLVQNGIKSNQEPDWSKMAQIIKSGYNTSFVEPNVIPGKVAYYRKTKQWTLYAKFLVLQQKQAGIENWQASPTTSYIINNDADDVFQYSKDKNELETALAWIDKALSMQSNTYGNAVELDTKANILYKLGRTAEGLKVEAQSISLAPTDKDIQDNYDKMKRGVPTWPTQ